MGEAGGKNDDPWQCLIVCLYFPPSISKLPRFLPFSFSISFLLFLTSHSGYLHFKLPSPFSFKRALSLVQTRSSSPSKLPFSSFHSLPFFLSFVPENLPLLVVGRSIYRAKRSRGRVPVVAHGEQRCPSHDTERGLQRARLCWLVVIRGRGALGFGSNMRGEREREERCLHYFGFFSF